MLQNLHKNGFFDAARFASRVSTDGFKFTDLRIISPLVIFYFFMPLRKQNSSVILERMSPAKLKPSVVIRRAIVKDKRSLRELSEAADISVSNLSRFVNGKADLRVEHFENLMRLLGFELVEKHKGT